MTRLFSILFILCSLQSIAQDKNALAVFKSHILVADQFYDQLDYRSALHFYTKSLEKDPDNNYVRLRLAQCYVNLNDTKSAEPWLMPLANETNADMQRLSLQFPREDVTTANFADQSHCRNQ